MYNRFLVCIGSLITALNLCLAAPVAQGEQLTGTSAFTFPAGFPSPTAKPVLSVNFPDPAFIREDTTFYAFGTAGNGKRVQIASSPAFINPTWDTLDVDILPDPGSWTDGSQNIWAPFVVKAENGQYVLYYSAPPSSDPTKHCIGTATSSTITGPFVPSPLPWTCPLDEGGAIDAAAFKDPQTDRLYILYKIDGNSLNADESYHPTPIRIQEVDPFNGITPISSPITLIDREEDDGPLVEAPGMFYSQGLYYLIFSSKMYNSAEYDLKYAVGTNLTSTFTRQDHALLYTGVDGLVSPGSATIDQDGNLLFHGTVGFDQHGAIQRYMYAGTISARNGVISWNGLVDS